jgi:hypothetical protein
MAKSTDSVLADWNKLAALSEADRTAQMVERFTQIHALDAGARRDSLGSIILGEDDLSNDELAEFSKSRLLAWLSMDKETAKQVAGEFQAAMDVAPGKVAMKHATIDQTVSLHFDHDQVTLLAYLDPKIFRSMPGVGSVETDEPETPVAEEAPPPWWKFW